MIRCGNTSETRVRYLFSIGDWDMNGRRTSKKKTSSLKLIEQTHDQVSGETESEARTLVNHLLEQLKLADAHPRVIEAAEKLGHFTLSGARTMDSMVAYGNGGYTMVS
jgi:hypothetical protein